jgi:predicted AAA+ superfamily ATPase
MSVERWRSLEQRLDDGRAATAEEYVHHQLSCADEVVRRLVRSRAFSKILLVGARGGGKSSEMRESARQLERR